MAVRLFSTVAWGIAPGECNEHAHVWPKAILTVRTGKRSSELSGLNMAFGQKIVSCYEFLGRCPRLR